MKTKLPAGFSLAALALLFLVTASLACAQDYAPPRFADNAVREEKGLGAIKY